MPIPARMQQNDIIIMQQNDIIIGGTLYIQGFVHTHNVCLLQGPELSRHALHDGVPLIQLDL